MDKLSVALTAILFLGLAAFMAPNILALNRGKILRNIAIWLAIFAGLGLIYQNFITKGSSGTAPLFSLSRPQATPPADDSKTNGSQGFTPPGE